MINEQESFRPGMSVTADIETRSRKDVVTVPFQSVTTRMPVAGKGGANESDSEGDDAKKLSKEDRKKANKPIEVVFVIEEDKAKMVPVERGISDDNYVEITSGLEADQVVVSGSYKAIAEDLEDGKSVKVKGGKGSGKKTTDSETP